MFWHSTINSNRSFLVPLVKLPKKLLLNSLLRDALITQANSAPIPTFIYSNRKFSTSFRLH